MHEITSILETQNSGIVLAVPIDVELTDEDLVIPDILFVKNENKEIVTEKRIVGPPNFIIEILSSNTKRDLS